MKIKTLTSLVVMPFILSGCLTPDLDQVRQNRPPLGTASPVPSQTVTPVPPASLKPNVVTIYVVSKLPRYFELLYNLEEVIAGWQKAKWTKLELVNKCPIQSYTDTRICLVLSERNMAEHYAGESVFEKYVGLFIYLNKSLRFRSQYEQQTTLCHEFGHILGLGHTKTKKSCMKNVELGTSLPTKLDIDLVNALGPWEFGRMSVSSAHENVDTAQLPN